MSKIKDPLKEFEKFISRPEYEALTGDEDLRHDREKNLSKKALSERQKAKEKKEAAKKEAKAKDKANENGYGESRNPDGKPSYPPLKLKMGNNALKRFNEKQPQKDPQISFRVNNREKKMLLRKADLMRMTIKEYVMALVRSHQI